MDAVHSNGISAPASSETLGDGRLLDNLGAVRGSCAVQMANGRAQISLQLFGHKAVVSIAAKGFSTQFLNVTATN